MTDPEEEAWYEQFVVEEDRIYKEATESKEQEDSKPSRPENTASDANIPPLWIRSYCKHVNYPPETIHRNQDLMYKPHF